MDTVRIVYNDKISRQFVFASVGWGIVGMLVGAIVALQLAFHPANVEPLLTFGRLRPLHTNAVIFAFVGNMMFAGVYYSMQRLLQARVWSDTLASIHFWGWQAIIVAAALTLPLGITQGKEYAELAWPIDLAIAAVWVIFGFNFFATLKNRNEKHLYVALWFYIATIVTVALLHIVNSLMIPVAAMHSYSLFGGVQDGLVQWWYGHNAVAFFLTTPILGIMYYFVPKAADRPVFSYRLSIVHFWALVFLYIWAGPHHLLNTALPEWAQTLGMVFSLMLWAPSWGGMVNGLLTLRGAWQKLRTDPVLKFFAAGVTFYGMSTLEGPLLSIRSVSSLAHYTDWIIGHVHSGALGWNGFMAAGMFYWMIPRLYGRELHSRSAANWHFWIGTFGIVLYVVAMWISGVTQGLMWRATNEEGGLLYSFVETVQAILPMYWMRLIGGTLYLAGMVVMLWNLVMTAVKGRAVDGEVTVAIERPTPAAAEPSWARILLGPPVVVTLIVLALLVPVAITNAFASTTFVFFAAAAAFVGAIAIASAREEGRTAWHRLIEGRPLIFTVLTALAVLAGGVAELVPVVVTHTAQRAAVRRAPYTALQLEGRDVYVAEGCYTCHSQMIRPLVWETQRYGAPSTIDESLFDHPFQWGSKRTGPDLARVGGKYSHLWHYQHLVDPRSTSPGSIMPAYATLADRRLDFGRTHVKLAALHIIGVPFSRAQIDGAGRTALRDARAIAGELRREGGVQVRADTEMVALIGYLQRLGRPEAAEEREQRPAPNGGDAPVARVQP